jgi:glycine cleavage system H lipoate-binding protein
MFFDQYSVHAFVSPIDMIDIKGFKIPQGYYLHRGHAWARIEEEHQVRIGVDDFALRLLGPLDRINAPLIGKEVKQDEKEIFLFRGENMAELLSPLSGVVTSINPILRERGTLANEDPYSEGWVMMIEPYRLRKELKELMLDNESGLFMDGQIEKLYESIEDIYGPIAADGGYLGFDIYGNMPELGWDRLKKTFLTDDKP